MPQFHELLNQEKPKRKRSSGPNWILWSAIGVSVLVIMLVAGGLFFVTGTETRTLVTAHNVPAGGQCASIIDPAVQPVPNRSNYTNDSRSGGIGATVLGVFGGDSDADSVDMAMEALPDTAVGGAPAAVHTSVASMRASHEAVGEAELAPPSDRDADGMAFDDVDAIGAAAEERRALPMTATAPMPTTNTVQQQVQPLRAGEINDNAQWETYLEYRTNFLNQYGETSVIDVNITERQIIRVQDQDGDPLMGACVQVYNGQSLVHESLTYATGQTMFFPNILPQTEFVEAFEVVVTRGTMTQETSIDLNEPGSVTTVTFPVTEQTQNVQLDVVFLLDATGSMADEIAQLQENILAISDQIDGLPGQINARYGLVSYRDRGDAYVTDVHDFEADVRDFQDTLRDVEANGGGDYPEDLNSGLQDALNSVDWRANDTIKLIFLVADAPPHVDYPQQTQYPKWMQSALMRGIKVHPIASSGLQPEGEFILRQIAQYTMGSFIFLTYDDGNPGTPGDERPDLAVGDPKDEQGVGDYDVSQLDEIVLRLIEAEIAALRGE